MTFNIRAPVRRVIQNIQLSFKKSYECRDFASVADILLSKNYWEEKNSNN